MQSGRSGPADGERLSALGAVNAVIGCFDRPAANAARRAVGRSWGVLLPLGAVRYFVVGAATVIGCPAQDRASQEKADQEIGEECSHSRGSRPGQDPSP